MSDRPEKIGFWAVFALVTGCQMDSVVFMLPANLAPYGFGYLGGWALSCLGAVALALVFAQLCAWYPKTGGPHVYVKEAFGSTAAFFTGWTYWVISWVSSTAIVVVSISYLTPLLSRHWSMKTVALEILLMVIVTVLNFCGVKTAGGVGLVLSIIRFFPLLVVPILALFFFDPANFIVAPSVAHLTLPQTLNQVILFVMWGFVGLESATTSAGSIQNPSKTIPRAVLLGTLFVGILYLINSLGIMGIIPGSKLMHSSEPYVDAARVLFGGSWHLAISLIASISCIVALNAWILTSGQAALGLARDGFLPAFFMRKNRFNAPYWGIAISCIGMIFLLVFTANETIAERIFTIIDFSVITFLFVYAICCFAFFKLLFQKKGDVLFLIRSVFCGLVALAFCGWVIVGTPARILLIASLFTVSGVPFFIHFLRTRKNGTVYLENEGLVPATGILFNPAEHFLARNGVVFERKGEQQREKENQVL
ncbi:amino acid permease [Candidatus Dependentiae bacterium HGW-Dependentiae-1]|nr:MAG: amino acid permease [Candidatus Dependentiae bacterium HGW-Dependentiae-1]